MTHYRRRPPLTVKLPDRQQRVLDAFFAGHLPAGQLDRALAAAAQMDTGEVEITLAAERRRLAPRWFSRAAA